MNFPEDVDDVRKGRLLFVLVASSRLPSTASFTVVVLCELSFPTLSILNPPPACFTRPGLTHHYLQVPQRVTLFITIAHLLSEQRRAVYFLARFLAYLCVAPPLFLVSCGFLCVLSGGFVGLLWRAGGFSLLGSVFEFPVIFI